MSKAIEFISSGHFQHQILRAGINSTNGTITHASGHTHSNLLDETIEIQTFPNKPPNVCLINADFDQAIILNSNTVKSFGKLIFKLCTISQIDCPLPITLELLDITNAKNASPLTIKKIEGSLFIKNKRNLDLKCQISKIEDFLLKGTFNNLEITNITHAPSDSVKRCIAKIKYSNLIFRKISIEKCIFNLNQEKNSTKNTLFKGCKLNSPIFTTNTPMNLSIKSGSLTGHASFRICSDTILNWRNLGCEQVSISPLRSNDATFCTINANRVTTLRQVEHYTDKKTSDISLGSSAFYLNFSHVDIDSLTSEANTSFRHLSFEKCTIPNASSNGANFRKLHTFDVYNECAIQYGFFPEKREYWPRLLNKNFIDTENWHRSFVALRDQAEGLNRQDDKDFYIWLSQNFRLFSTNDRITKVFLWMYKWSSSFGRNPFYPLSIWLALVVFFTFLHSIINIFPSLTLPQKEFYVFFWGATWLPEAMKFASLGLFPLSGVADQNIAHALVSSLHKVLSGVLFFLIGFCIRNHAKL